MIQCDYCRQRINQGRTFRTVTTKQRDLHLHDDQPNDCADAWMEAARTIQGDRPPATTTNP